MKSIKCPQCGFVGWADAERCKKCGVSQLPDPDDNSDLFPETRGNYSSPYQSYSDQDLKKGLAMTSLVLGVLNLMIFGIFLIPSIVGIVCAAVAQKRAKREPHVYGGQGLATAGLVTNIISVAMVIPVLIIAAIAIPNLLAARRAANEAATISSLRKIHSAEATYQATVGNGEFGTLDQLGQARLLSAELSAASHYGYRFAVVVEPAGYEEPGKFHVTAVPLEYGSSGNRSFYIDESGVIRAENIRGAEATDLSPPLNFDGYSPGAPRPRRYTDD